MDLTSLLVCPSCRTPVEESRGDEPGPGGGYRCPRCGAWYPVREGIPCMFAPRDGLPQANQALFDALADHYETSLPPHIVAHYLEKRVRFLKARGLRPPLLEVGCGTGRLAARLAQEGLVVVGLDASLGMLRHLRQPGATAVAAYSDALPFPDDSFPLAFSVATLHHLVEPALVAATLGEMVRVVQRGGEVIVWDHNPLNPYWPLLMRRMPQDAGATRLVSAAELVSLLEHSGARVVALRRLGFVPDFVPSLLLPAVQRVEGLLERLPLVRSLAAHNVVVAQKV